MMPPDDSKKPQTPKSGTGSPQDVVMEADVDQANADEERYDSAPQAEGDDYRLSSNNSGQLPARPASHTCDMREKNMLMFERLDDLQHPPYKRARVHHQSDSGFDSDLSTANHAVAQNGSCDWHTFVTCHGSV